MFVESKDDVKIRYWFISQKKVQPIKELIFADEAVTKVISREGIYQEVASFIFVQTQQKLHFAGFTLQKYLYVKTTFHICVRRKIFYMNCILVKVL